MGKGLYEKHGYREVDSFTLDLSKYRVEKSNGAHLYTTYFMIRPANVTPKQQ